tara:strand:+ start:922 stop:1308 length:387 start_codon:yes stop_codon:yes gene_type:complete
MVLKIVTTGAQEKYLNGEQIVDKHFNVKIDSQEKPKKQVSATVQDSGNVYHMTDSLQSFINNLNRDNDSIFEFLGKEQYRLKHTLPFINKKVTRRPSNKILNKLKKTRKILKKPFTRRRRKKPKGFNK